MKRQLLILGSGMSSNSNDDSTSPNYHSDTDLMAAWDIIQNAITLGNANAESEEAEQALEVIEAELDRRGYWLVDGKWADSDAVKYLRSVITNQSSNALIDSFNRQLNLIGTAKPNDKSHGMRKTCLKILVAELYRRGYKFDR